MKYIIFGAGETGKMALDVFGKENVEFFIDNNKKKQADGFEGYRVHSLEEALIRRGDAKIVIAVIPNYEKEIMEQLRNAGVSDFIRANTYIYAERRERLSKRKDYISVYNNAILWIKNHTIKNKGIVLSSSESVIYPEVTGYFIPTLLRWGYRDLAIEYAKGLMGIQRSDGAWNGPHNDIPYVFDTAQILKGLLSARNTFSIGGLDEAIMRGGDWILSNMQPNGRLATPDMEEWGKDDTICSELIHLYCLSPLIEVTEITGNEKYKDAADKILEYYISNYENRIIHFSHLSHFHAYLMEALLDMGREDIVSVAMRNMGQYQKDSGAVPAYNNCDWVCSTGLFQLALVWFRIGEVERGNRAFAYACNLQNVTGGWYGSYLSEDNLYESNSYFPLSEISWANKYFLDALYEKNKAEFNISAPLFKDSIDVQDERYTSIKEVAKAVKSGGVIADIGCGKGRYLKNLKEEIPEINYIGIDISKSVLTFVREEGITTRLGTLTNIPLEDNSVDMAYSCEALEHAIDIESSIREMARIIKPSGHLVIVDKSKESLGRFEITEWEQWFDKDCLKSIMLKYCSEVKIFDDISYDNLPSDGLFITWIGVVK